MEREFDPDAVRRLKANAAYDITVDGPELAAQAIRAGLVDEFQMIVCPVVVGSGKRFFPDGVRLDLELVEERRFRKGVVVLRLCSPRLIDVKGWNVTPQAWVRAVTAGSHDEECLGRCFGLTVRGGFLKHL
jgi:hypothetical protein